MCHTGTILTVQGSHLQVSSTTVDLLYFKYF